jgi:hypothetical protein
MMAAPKVSTIVKTVTRRAWTDLEPKLIAFLATGLTVTGVITAADYAGIHINADQASLAVVIISAIAGYIKKSTSTVENPKVDPAASSSPTM